MKKSKNQGKRLRKAERKLARLISRGARRRTTLRLSGRVQRLRANFLKRRLKAREAQQTA